MCKKKAKKEKHVSELQLGLDKLEDMLLHLAGRDWTWKEIVDPFWSYRVMRAAK